MNEGSSIAAVSQTMNESQASQSQQSTAGDAAASGGNSSANQGGGDGGQVDMAKIFGDDFVKDPALSKFKDPKAFAQSYKEMQSQVGKYANRVELPNEQSTPEQTKAFWEKMGVPREAAAYNLSVDKDGKPYENDATKTFMTGIGDIALQANMLPAQVKAIQGYLEGVTEKYNAAMQESEAAQDMEMTTFFQKAFGDDAGVNLAVERITAELEKVFPQNMRDILSGKINKEGLVAMAILDQHYRKTYGQSDTTAGEQGGNIAGSSVAELRKIGMELYAKIQKNGTTHPDYKADKARYDQIYEQIDALTKSSK